MTNIMAEHILTIDVETIKPNPKNRNSHSDEQIERLCKIIKYQGFRNPLIISKRSGLLVAGHGRLLAAKKLGLEKVPVIYQDFEDEDQEYTASVSDNSIASWAELDLSGINADLSSLGPFDIDLLGIKDFVLEPSEKYGDKDADAVPVQRETTIKLGDLFQLGAHRLLCGDSTSKDNVAKLMGGEKADMVFTDPPYGINASNGETVTAGAIKAGKLASAGSYKKIEGDENTDIARAAYKIFSAYAKKQIIFGGNYFTDFLPVNGHWLVWSKKGYEKTDTFSDAELAWTNIPQVSVKLYSHVWDGMWREGNRDEELKTRVHPTQKPVGLISNIIKDYSADGESVLDLFLGSGSTLIACEKTNRRCYGMEIDPQYCQVIIDRWEKFTGKKAEKIGGTIRHATETEAF